MEELEKIKELLDRHCIMTEPFSGKRTVFERVRFALDLLDSRGDALSNLEIYAEQHGKKALHKLVKDARNGVPLK